MTMNRLLTSLLQLTMWGALTPMLIAVYKDIKENGFFPIDEEN